MMKLIYPLKFKVYGKTILPSDSIEIYANPLIEHLYCWKTSTCFNNGLYIAWVRIKPDETDIPSKV